MAHGRVTAWLLDFMNVLNNYLSKHRVFPDWLNAAPAHNLLIAVVIPVHNEPEILPTLEALANCESTNGKVEARKMGMDEAVSRFAKINQEKGIIVCFDADCTCASNYLIEIEKAFEKYAPKAMSIRFEHPLSGVEYDQRIYDYITDYELHLRVYKNAINFAGLPYGYHTVGSSMAVSVMDYCKQGGMNKRKAGEDFYAEVYSIGTHL